MADDVVFLQPGRAAFAAAQKGLDVEAHGDIQENKVLGDWRVLLEPLDRVRHPRNGGGPTFKSAGDVLSILHRRSGR